jgi:hypothetical protein
MPDSEPRFRFADPATAASYAPRARWVRGKYLGDCPRCGGRDKFTARWGDNGGTVVGCLKGGSFCDLLGFYRERGWWLSPDLLSAAKKLRRAKVCLDVSWETSAAAFACTTVERRIDTLIDSVEPDAQGRRLITVRELQELIATPRLVAPALRVLETLGRWKRIKVPFAREGRVFWRNGFVKADAWRRFVPLGLRPEDLGPSVLDARDAARKARFPQKLQTANTATTGPHLSPLSGPSNRTKEEDRLHTADEADVGRRFGAGPGAEDDVLVEVEGEVVPGLSHDGALLLTVLALGRADELGEEDERELGGLAKLGLVGRVDGRWTLTPSGERIGGSVWRERWRGDSDEAGGEAQGRSGDRA